MDQQFLIFDADDTLWENNIYFEEAFDRFFNYLAHSSMTPDQVRSVLDEIEEANAKLHGYGARNFATNLATCFRHLSERGVSQTDQEAVEQFAYAILDAPMTLLDGVADTIADLASKHTLLLFTKGDPDEQRLKIDRSGLRQHFAYVAIVKEKNETAYRELLRSQQLEPERAWMIGNSPRSDILPALAAGLSAVYVPHPRTWSLERAAIPDESPNLKQVQSIRDLRLLF